MKPIAIVYTSKTGHTRAYAAMLGGKTGLPVYPLAQAMTALPAGSCVIYLGWLRASCICGFRKARKRFVLCAACGVGLCDTGTLLPEVRKATSVPADMPLFTLQGGFDSRQQKGFDRLIISMLTRGLASQKQRTAQDERMLRLLRENTSYVCEENLADVLRWYQEG